ncbi:hypothetical protein B1R94_21590 [Mycolicibacterium litorale]|nr:hypothetical protein B1R94_21590 [Mycolicibacterium litorale]
MPGQPRQWNTTARVLRRCGFGVTGAEVDAVTTTGWQQYLASALASDPDADPGALATPMPSLDLLVKPRRNAVPFAQYRQYFRDLNAQMSELSWWWLTRMVQVQEPVHEKLTLLWHNHFATSAAKVKVATYMAAQNQTLRTRKLGDFRDLAYAMLTDAATVMWLDGQTNTAAAPNENLAREFMELFALGHGNGYDEDDVRNGARALTGWVVDRDGATAFKPHRHDSTTKTVLGVTGDLGAAEFCDAVLAAPKSAEFVVGRLWRQLAIDSPPSDAVTQRLLSAYGPGRDLRALTVAVLTDREFVAAPAGIVNTPVEWLVGVLRAGKVPLDTPRLTASVTGALRTLGQRPFYPPSVGGWPHGPAWLSTSSASTRFQIAEVLARAADLSTIESAAPSDRVDAVGYLIGIGSWSDRSVAALKPSTDNPAALFVTAVNTPEYLTS